jgi:rhodanese-related sulfurtransferase
MGGVLLVQLFVPSVSSTEARIKDHYETETSVLISPSTLRKRMDAKDQTFVLIDLRSKGEYDKEHIVGAVNIPAVSMTKEQIITAFKKLPKDKEIIVHCYSMVCMLGRQTGEVLAQNGIYVKELGIGWSEWKYYWGLWNPGEDPEKGKAYVVSSSEAEKNAPAPLIAPCTEGEFGC